MKTATSSSQYTPGETHKRITSTGPAAQFQLDRRAQQPELRFIRIREVLSICGRSRSSIYAAVKRGEFPAPVKLGARTSAWIKSEVLIWAESRISSRGGK